ncbi:hypothetical protein EV1_043545 [Malus domestica]
MEGGQSSGIGRDPFEHQFSLENNTAEDVVDLGSSTDSPQLVDPTRSTESLTEAEFNNLFSNPSHEQPANLAPNGISFSNLYAEAMGSNPEIMAQLNPEDSLPPISDAPNFLLPPLPEVTFSHLLPRACQPYPPHMEEQEFGSSAGNNWYGLNPANSTQNLMPGGAGFSSYQFSNPHFPYPQNENVGTPFFFNPLISSSTPPYRPVQMPVGDVMVEPFHEQEQLPLSLTLGPNQYATSTMMAGHSGGNQRPSYLNQQPAAFFYPQSVNPATQLLIPPGFWPQHNQVIQGYGAFNPQGNNSVPYGAAQIRPQPQYTLQLLNQPQQMNQVPENPFQVGEDSGIWVLESSLARAPPRQQEQINKGKAALARKAQNSNSNPPMQSRPRGVAKSRPSIPIPIRPRPSVLPNIADPPHHSSAPSKTQMPFRFPPIQLEEIMNQSNVTSDSSFKRSSQLQNSLTEQGEIPEQGFSEKQHGKRPIKVSSPAKSSERTSAASSHREVNRSTFEPQENELTLFTSYSVPPNPRQIKNSLYDPAFEAMGLPIDPHLRMLLAPQPNPHAKK